MLYRLRVLQINIPPLRSRGDDSLLLAQCFVTLFANVSRDPQRYRKTRHGLQRPATAT